MREQVPAGTDEVGVAGVPDEVAFATKQALSRRMIDRAAAVGVPARWAMAAAVATELAYVRIGNNVTLST